MLWAMSVVSYSIQSNWREIVEEKYSLINLIMFWMPKQGHITKYYVWHRKFSLLCKFSEIQFWKWQKKKIFRMQYMWIFNHWNSPKSTNANAMTHHSKNHIQLQPVSSQDLIPFRKSYIPSRKTALKWFFFYVTSIYLFGVELRLKIITGSKNK